MAIPVFVLLCGLCGLFVVTLLRRPWDKKRPLPAGPTSAPVPTITQGPDMELANLRQLPIGNSFKNDMYDLSSEGDLELLPKIKRNQIVLTRFIGKQNVESF